MNADGRHPKTCRRRRYAALVSFNSERVLPHLIDWSCRSADLRPWRAGVTAGLTGKVVEIGFGSGLNVDLYPSSVERVYAVEPAEVALRLAQKRIKRSNIAIEHAGLDGQHIPLESESCDSALSTFTLCTIPDVRHALAEIHRVLRPGASFHFLEHGLSRDARVARWQRHLEPLQLRLADGCHLTREPAELVREAGFVIDQVEQRYAAGPKPWSWITSGVAVKPK